MNEIDKRRKALKYINLGWDGDDGLRGTGRTTGCCMSIIGQALQNPNTLIPFYDHEPHSNGHFIKHVTTATVNSIISRLGLIGFEIVIKGNNRFLRYDLTPWEDL